MYSPTEKQLFIMTILIFFSGIIVGFCICHGEFERKLKEAAIKHNATQYNPKTGQFEWKDEAK